MLGLTLNPRILGLEVRVTSGNPVRVRVRVRVRVTSGNPVRVRVRVRG